MASFVSRILTFLGLDEAMEPEEEMVEQDSEAAESTRYEFDGKVVSLRSQRNTKFVIVEPGTFGEVQTICEHLRRRRPVIVNVWKAEPGVSRRILDFASGCAYGLGGKTQRISEGIFLFAPSNFEVTADRDTETDGPVQRRSGQRRNG